ncbi:MAG: LysR family transcriptional regulator, partial [Silicimonas sp.]|nr:LysR family transcriptional regulator [Silicimonas sp.]
GEEVLRLEYGEAHVALRAGTKPDNPDNVVQPFNPLCTSLFASKGYVERYGRPESFDDFAGHKFVGYDNLDSPAPFFRWLMERISPDQVIFRAKDSEVIRDAILADVGIGFASCWDKATEGLVQLFPPRPEWSAPLWLVTHVDLHRTTKVQAFLTFLKEEAKAW